MDINPDDIARQPTVSGLEYPVDGALVGQRRGLCLPSTRAEHNNRLPI